MSYLLIFSIFLEVTGGGGFFLNKVFLSLAERSQGIKQRLWKIRSWLAYIIGLPPIVVLFLLKENWIAASVEAGGAPAMIVGLIIAWRGYGQQPRWLDGLAYVAALIGFTVSIYDFGGITTVNQVLEIGIAVGFLFGTLALAYQRPGLGYPLFMLMNLSCGLLMIAQDYYIMFVQQILSLGFVIDAYWVYRRTSR